MLAKPCLHSIKQQGKKGDTVSMHKYDNNAGILLLIGQRFNVSGDTICFIGQVISFKQDKLDKIQEEMEKQQQEMQQQQMQEQIDDLQQQILKLQEQIQKDAK